MYDIIKRLLLCIPIKPSDVPSLAATSGEGKQLSFELGWSPSCSSDRVASASLVCCLRAAPRHLFFPFLEELCALVSAPVADE